MAALLSACPPPPVDNELDGGQIHLADAGPFVPPADAGFDDGGNPIVDAGPVNSVVIVESVTPPTGPVSGFDASGLPVRIVIDGAGFAGVDSDNVTSLNHVFVDGIEASLVLGLQLPNKISAQVPPCTSPGPKTVRVVNPLGIGELVGGFTCFSPVSVTSIDPPSGSTDGGELVTMHGLGFTPNMIVTVGGRQVVGLTLPTAGDDTVATFFTPPGSPGRVDVVATDAFGRSVLDLAYTYQSPLTLTSVTPNVVDDVGAVVELDGSGYVEDVSATIGATLAARDNLISDARLRVVVPTGLSGAQDVTVERTGAPSATLAGALVVRPAVTGALALSAAVPNRADAAGGDVVTLVGEQLTGATAVTFGGTAATAFTVVDDRTITATVPAGAVGPVDVAVTTGAGTATLAGGLTYFAAVVVDDVNPGFGPVAGGTAVSISGRGFVDPATVTFGGIPADDVVVVSDTEITATTPAGAAGPVSVAVESNNERGVLENAFRFDAALSVIGVRPSRGGEGGDTFVTITGTGFTKGPVSVFFGDADCVTTPANCTQAFQFDVHVVSDSVLTARTPPHEPGLVGVTVIQGAGALQQTSTAPSIFTYFNPTNVVGGTRGGPIDGAVYITALDGVTGLPVPSIVAYVGTSDQPIASGITNVLGQATISGPDVFGPQTVSVMGECYSTASFVDVDAAELTVYLFPLCGSPPSSGDGPPPPPPATIRGRVFGFAKEFFDPAALDQSGCTVTNPGPNDKCEIAFAEVQTTSPDEFSGTPNPGGDNVAFEEGDEYFIANSRTGRLAVVALAGIFDINNGTFRLRQLGVRREVFPQHGVDLVDQDIDLTIDLDNTIDLSLPDAPLRAVNDDINAGFLPTITRVIPFLQFGGEGAFVYTQAVEGKRNHVLDTMPKVPGELLTFVSGAYTTDGRNQTASAGTVSLAAGQTTVNGSGVFEWGQQDLNGNFVIVGQVFVTINPNTGLRFASVISGTDGVSTLQLQEPPDFDVSNVAYHIGNPGPPSSEVIQDGVGDMRGGITIQPVLGLPQLLSPPENGVLVDRTLRWKAAPGQQPTIHDMFLFEPFNLSTIWEFYVDGSRTKVIIPQIPELDAILRSLPTAEGACLTDASVSEACGLWFPDPGFASGQKLFVPPADMARGGMAWQHEAIFKPGLDYTDWSLLDIGTRGRRAWTTDLHIFVHGDD